MKSALLTLALVLATVGVATARDTRLFSVEEIELISHLSPLPPPPADPTNALAEDPAAARLGQYLFFDPRLSGSGTIACASCHSPRRGWSDGQPLGHGIGRTRRHTATLWNAAYNRWFFWDGHADSLWSQALGPLEDPNEHGGSRLQYAHLIYSTPDLRGVYESLFGPLPPMTERARFPLVGRPVPTSPADPSQQAWASMQPADQDAINRVFANLGKAIAAYERRLISRGAPFDRFVEGIKEKNPDKLRALSIAAQRGLRLFIGKANCASCHAGPNLSDGEFHDIGLPPRRDVRVDTGRLGGVERLLSDPFNSLGIYSDNPADAASRPTSFLVRQPHQRGQFKTPTLRNVADTAPYMHDGRFATLDDVVRFYSTREGAAPIPHDGETILKPLHLSAAEAGDLIAFLHALTGAPISPDLTKQPASPRLTNAPPRMRAALAATSVVSPPPSAQPTQAAEPALASRTDSSLPTVEYRSDCKAAVGDGLLAVTKPKTGQVMVFNLRADAPHLLATVPFTLAGGVAIDGPRHRLYVSDALNHRIHVFGLPQRDADSMDVPFLRAVGRRGRAPGEFDEPGALAVDHDGNLYVADFLNARIQMFAPDLHLLRQWGEPGTQPGQLNGPMSIAVDSRNAIYIVDSFNYRVQVFTAEGQFLRTWGARWGDAQAAGAGVFLFPFAVAVDTGGVFVTDSSRHLVLRFDEAGRLVQSLSRQGHAPGELYKPKAIVVDERGRLIVVDHGDNRAQIFTPGGDYVGTFFVHQ